MNKLISYYLIPSFIVLFVHMGFAQNYNSLSQEQQLELRLRSHLYLQPKNIQKSTLKNILSANVPIAIEYETKKDWSFIQKISKHCTNLVIISKKNSDSLYVLDPSFIYIHPKQIQNINLDSTYAVASKKNHFHSVKPFGAISYKKNSSVSDSLLYSIWNNSGKLPNFISADSSTLKKTVHFVKLFNSTEKIFGVVKTKQHLLENVAFKNFEHRKANGLFSFPRKTTENQSIGLIPYKAGYYFSPDIIFTTDENSNNQKEFNAFPLSPTFGLTDHFEYDKTLNNSVRNMGDEIVLNNIKIVPDSAHKSVGYFNKRAYIDTGISSRTALKSSFTITAWIKPTQRGNANSILGKGDNFVLKITNGYLTFTMAGIKDYISRSSEITLNEWTHIALVHSEINNDLQFYINGQQTDRVDLIANYETTNYNLLIGSNLWEEFFIGYMGPIKIWERELNKNEIKNQFKNKSPKKSFFNQASLAIGFIVLCIGLFYFFKTRLSNKTKRQQKKQGLNDSTTLKPLLENNFKEKIFCFGSLQIINSKDIDIAPNLSPKLKQLFLVIFLHSLGEKNGISTKKLTSLLWPGMSAQSAKNTRGTNIQNLRSVLSSCTEISVDFKHKLWSINMSENCYCDYLLANNLFKQITENNYNVSLLNTKLPILVTILNQGRLLNSSNASWLDPYIEKFSHNLIEQCFNYIENLAIKENGKLILSIIDVIYLYDDLNENALRIKMQIFIQQGKLSFAKTTYDNFVKLYQKLYKETYTTSFEDIISEYQL